MRKIYTALNSNKMNIASTLLAVTLIILEVIFRDIVYAERFLILAGILTGTAVVLLIIYALVDGKEYLRISAYILFAITYVICMILFIFTSSYEFPYKQNGRYRPIMSRNAAVIEQNIRKDLSAEKIFGFNGFAQRKETEENYYADVKTFFEQYDIRGSFFDDYTYADGNIDVRQEYCYLDRITDSAEGLKTRYLSGIESGEDYNFREKDYIVGEKYGIKYQYMYKRLSGNTVYFIVYMQDEDTFFAMRTRIKSNSNLHLDEEKAMENMLMAVNENGMMKVGQK